MNFLSDPHCKGEKKETLSSCCASQDNLSSETLENSSLDWSVFLKDFLFLSTFFIILFSFLSYFFFFSKDSNSLLFSFVSYSVLLIKKMSLGMILSFCFVGILGKIPREFVIAALGRDKGGKGIVRAALLGLLFDVCSHGVVLIGMKLYERGASLSQVMAFLIASPWNSFSLTVILISLIGWKWTLLFVLFSFLVALLSGVIFEALVRKKVLPQSPYFVSLPENFDFFQEVKKHWEKRKKGKRWRLLQDIFLHGVYESRIVLKWLFFGVILASLVSVLFGDHFFETYFSVSVIGLGFTLFASTLIEVCSEGATPLAAEIVNKAKAPGNGFVFLMAGVSTDYTEIVILKERTKSWKIAFFLPLVTLPQILILGFLMNFWS